METLTAFPPLHSLMISLSKIDYKKHLNNLITIALFIAAVVYVVSQKLMVWWKETGKDLTLQTIEKVWNILSVCYTWVRSKGYPALTNAVDNVMQTYHNWQGLMTVA